ncbi:MAG TPA: hypothetical protein P5136_01440 [Methanofastidiosum sp.]|nr:hypothetical protein [Methanofastidiosum sp.]
MKASTLKPKIKEGMVIRWGDKRPYHYYKIVDISLTSVVLNPIEVGDGIYKIQDTQVLTRLSDVLRDSTYLSELDEFELQLSLIPAHDI